MKTKWIVIERKKRQPGEPAIEIYGYWRRGRVPLPKIFVIDNGYVIQWSDGSCETVPHPNPLDGAIDFTLNYIGGMLAFRFKPVIVIDAKIYDKFVALLNQ